MDYSAENCAIAEIEFFFRLSKFYHELPKDKTVTGYFGAACKARIVRYLCRIEHFTQEQASQILSLYNPISQAGINYMVHWRERVGILEENAIDMKAKSVVDLQIDSLWNEAWKVIYD